MDISIERTRVTAASPQKIVTAGGKTAKEAQGDGVQWIPVEFIKGIQIAWKWTDLLQDATQAEENLNLAMAGLVLSNNVEIAAYKGETVLRQLGFDGIKSDYYRLSTGTRNEISNPARTFGHKYLEENGQPVHVFAAVFKGTTTLPDTITDINSVADGFYTAGRNCADSLKAYIDSFDGAKKDNTILFITGHSLGASTANVAGRLSREFANEESTFVYTFASPNYETEGEWNNGESYPNFHYFTNHDDVVPRVPLRIPPSYFSKIGKEHFFNYNAMEVNQKQRFFRAYSYFRDMSFEEDKDLLGLGFRRTENLGYTALKNHLCHTYMSFILSELSDSEIDHYLTGK